MINLQCHIPGWYLEILTYMINQNLYKTSILILKVLPSILALFYLVANIFGSFKIYIPVLSYFGSLSLLPAIFILVSSKVFNFCIVHRLPIYFILLINFVNLLLLKFQVPCISYLWIIGIITLIFIIVSCIFKYKKKCLKQ